MPNRGPPHRSPTLLRSLSTQRSVRSRASRACDSRNGVLNRYGTPIIHFPRFMTRIRVSGFSPSVMNAVLCPAPTDYRLSFDRSSRGGAANRWLGLYYKSQLVCMNEGHLVKSVPHVGPVRPDYTSPRNSLSLSYSLYSPMSGDKEVKYIVGIKGFVNGGWLSARRFNLAEITQGAPLRARAPSGLIERLGSCDVRSRWFPAPVPAPSPPSVKAIQNDFITRFCRAILSRGRTLTPAKLISGYFRNSSLQPLPGFGSDYLYSFSRPTPLACFLGVHGIFNLLAQGVVAEGTPEEKPLSSSRVKFSLAANGCTGATIPDGTREQRRAEDGYITCVKDLLGDVPRGRRPELRTCRIENGDICQLETLSARTSVCAPSCQHGGSGDGIAPG
ncbi:hypothetical protein Bbelb_202650 [Branchiostoma belcheri]|nr:hypothetical protein Bbelb_202650 [Branchiostoma belcheri]